MADLLILCMEHFTVMAKFVYMRTYKLHTRKTTTDSE